MDEGTVLEDPLRDRTLLSRLDTIRDIKMEEIIRAL
jgi:hypothetical protein